MLPKQYDMNSVPDALDALQRTTGLPIQVIMSDAAHQDGYIVVGTEDGRRFELPYEMKPIIDRRDQLMTFKNLHAPAILITRSLTSAMAEQCRELDIQFIDHAGNCYIKQPGLYVFVAGAKSASTPNQATERGLTPSALRVVLAVLTRPAILHSNVRRIAEVASVSHGAAGAALVMLEEIGFFTTVKQGHRVIAMPERWLDTWTEGYLGRIRPKLERHRMSAPTPFHELIERVSPQMREVALGGEAAAAHRNLGLKPGTLTLYLDFKNPSVMRHLVQEFKLRRDPDGKIELINMFWNTLDLPSFPTVPDALIYADLVGIGDERAMEIATKLRKEICNHVASES